MYSQYPDNSTLVEKLFENAMLKGANNTNPNDAVRLIIIRIPEIKKVIDIKGLINPVAKIDSANALASGLPGYSVLGTSLAIISKDLTPISINRNA